MAGKTKPMRQIKQLLQMHKNGDGRKTIARKLGMSKTTIKYYLDKLKTMDIDTDSLLELDEPVLEAKFHAGNPAYKDNDRYGYIKENLEYFENELKRTGVTRKLLWEEYRANHPKGYGYTQFCFHFNQQLVARNPSMALQHKAAEKLYVDFAGAKNPLYIIRNGEIEIIKGDRFSIGGISRSVEKKEFNNNLIDINKDATCYIFSDGYMDQLGGEAMKKFSSPKFQDLLLKIHNDDFETQKKKLDEVLTEWMRNTNQRDDILLIGFKVSPN